jgi:hypothetical protein
MVYKGNDLHRASCNYYTKLKVKRTCINKVEWGQMDTSYSGQHQYCLYIYT